MKRFRKMSALAMTLVLVAGLFGCGGTSSGTASTAESTSSKSEVSQTGSTGEPWIISCSSTAPNTTDNTVGYVVAANVLNEKLMELSGGTMGFELILGGVYGSTAQHFAQLKAGTLDTFISGFDVATNLDGTEDFAAVAMPFVFDDDEHMDKFLESGLWAEMTETMRENNGIMYAGLYLHQPPRILTSRTEVVHPEDVKGMKIRVPESQVQIDVWTAAGANPMQVAATEWPPCPRA